MKTRTQNWLDNKLAGEMMSEDAIGGAAFEDRPLWGLAIAPLQRIIRSLTFDNRHDAVRRARDENRVGEYRGRGVKAVRLGTQEYPL